MKSLFVQRGRRNPQHDKKIGSINPQTWLNIIHAKLTSHLYDFNDVLAAKAYDHNVNPRQKVPDCNQRTADARMCLNRHTAIGARKTTMPIIA